jgi:hypothetical protein
MIESWSPLNPFVPWATCANAIGDTVGSQIGDLAFRKRTYGVKLLRWNEMISRPIMDAGDGCI